MTHPIRRTLSGTLVPILTLALPAVLEAQAGELGGQSLRGYWHVFAAYAAGWALILGWIVSIFRRLGRIDREMDGA
ncbi:MAG TPA: CcmD family protein [Longimicrobiales bacterium]|nr:CcmD family protein [Longimicrobiales bacterium]